MPQSTSHARIPVQLRQLIYYNLDNNLLKNALFLAQRLCAYDTSRNGDAAYLLALCQFQSGFTKASWDTTRSFATKGSHLGCVYVFAQASLELGRYVDGLHVIERSRNLWQGRNTWNQHSETRRQSLPDAAALLCLKGKLWKGHKNIDEAVQCWVAALKLNPFLWDAYTLLTDSGAKINVPNIYKINQDMVSSVHDLYVDKENIPEPLPFKQPVSTADPFYSTTKTTNHNGALFEKLNNSRLNLNTTNIHDDEMLIPTPSTILEDSDSVYPSSNVRWEAPPAPLRKVRSGLETQEPPRLKPTATRLKTRLKPANEESVEPSVVSSKRTISGHVASTNGTEPIRRSTRQTARPPSATSQVPGKMATIANSLGLRDNRDIKKPKAPLLKPRTATTSTVGRVVSGNRLRTGLSAESTDMSSEQSRQDLVPPLPTCPLADAPRASVVDKKELISKDIESLKSILDLLRLIAQAHNALSSYDMQSCITILNGLPSAHRETPLILSMFATAHNEAAQYHQAEKYFIRMRQLAPSSFEGMDLYSTVLYQLKAPVELAYLAHELSTLSRNHPSTWLALGNSFSLQRDHDNALKCFRRATQLDPSFAYAFTLAGHEHVENEEFEAALQSYRSAISVDDRHYNAWYGLGKVYARLGKWTVAESHYRTAASINPSNAVLTCAIGSIVERTKPANEALIFYEQACRLAPGSAMARFKKTKCLMSMGRIVDALRELEVLKEISPQEANVWFLAGKLNKMAGRRAEAVKAFTVALNLDPKAAQYIKDAMESLDDEEEGGFDDDEDMG